MTILRRYIDATRIATAHGVALDPGAAPELLVTFDTVTGDLLVGHRTHPWDAFSQPLPALRDEDDPAPQPGDRTGTRTYDVLNQAGEVIASVPDVEWHPAGDQDAGSETFVAVPPPAEESEQSRQGTL